MHRKKTGRHTPNVTTVTSKGGFLYICVVGGVGGEAFLIYFDEHEFFTMSIYYFGNQENSGSTTLTTQPQADELIV